METYRIDPTQREDAKSWLYKAYDYVRTDAFVCGQGIPIETEFAHDEPDEDLEAVILVDEHKPVAGCRITYPQAGTARIGRVCVVRERQRSGAGHILLAEAERWIAEKGVRHVVIESQDRALGFYERCGYRLMDETRAARYDDRPAREPDDAGETLRPRLGFTCVWVEKEL